MSKQEILSWTSLVTSVSFMVLYIIFMFGWPDFLPNYGNRFFELFFNLFWIALVIEIFVEINKNKDGVDKDERDSKIEAIGVKKAYSFLSAGIAFILVSIFLGNFLGEAIPVYTWFSEIKIIFHVLLLLLFSSNVIKRVTQIYHYKTVF